MLPRPQTAACPRRRAISAALSILVSDAKKRREWLWLRAHERHDEASMWDLERADPRLPSRLSGCVSEIAALFDPDARHDAYGRMLDERLPWPNGVDTPCECRACAVAA